MSSQGQLLCVCTFVEIGRLSTLYHRNHINERRICLEERAAVETKRGYQTEAGKGSKDGGCLKENIASASWRRKATTRGG